MRPTLTVACIILKLVWQAVCRPFSNQFRRLSPVRSGSIRSALAALVLAPIAVSMIRAESANASISLGPESRHWVDAVRAQDGGDWSAEDLKCIDALVAEINSNAELKLAKEQGRLLVAPFRGPNSESRRRCLYHPLGPVVQLAGPLPGSQYLEDGAHGDGTNYVDTLYDGTGLDAKHVSFIFDVKHFETLMCDRTAPLLEGDKTKLGNAFIYHKNYSANVLMGCTSNVYQGGLISNAAYPSGTIALLSQETHANQYRHYLDSRLIEGKPHGKLQLGPRGSSTFKLLANSKGVGSRAVLGTAVICPGLSDNAYLSLQTALAKANKGRRPDANVETVKDPMRIWIFAGQSNCCGDQVNTKNPNNQSVYPDDEWHPNVWQWARTGPEKGKPIRASNPLDFDGGGAPVGVGPALIFGKTLLDQNPRQRILIIPAAVGATGFSSHHWNPGDPVYEN